MPFSRAWLLALVVTVLLGAGVALLPRAVAFAQSGYNYTVQEGESWDTVATRTGVSVENLQEANPEAAGRESGWLLVGETLFVPTALAESPRTHTVQAGESWNSIAEKYDVPVALLRATNAGAVRSSNILYRGEVLIIPPAGARVASPTATATDVTDAAEVDADEVMTDTVEATEEATEEATVEATEEATVEPTEEATAEATPEATEEPTEQATVEPTDAVTSTEAMTETDALTDTVTVSEGITDTEVMTDSAVMTDTEAATDADAASDAGSTDEADASAFDLPQCPERFADYSQVMTELSNSVEDEGLEAVLAFLSACDALVDDGVVMADLNGDGADDLVAVYQNPSEDAVFVEGDLVIFNSSDSGYVLGYRARAAGEVRLLTVEDVNLDELPDVVWVDTTCGASTCFDTVNVRSWDGTSWADWTDGTITMAYAEIALTDVDEAGLGSEITLEGGIYGSVGAGPQRSRSEVWSSVEGAPYALTEKAYSPTECLYHTVLDANRAFLDAPENENGFADAIALYSQAVEDETLLKCWVRNDELAELRSFSLFRLALIAGYGDDADGAAARAAELSAQYPGSLYDEVGQVWLESYEASGDAAMACEDVTAFAEENSAVWEMLADYGYTNPSFEAIDVCPHLNMAPAEGEAEEEATE